MSATEKTRGKKTLILAIIAVCAAIVVLIAVFMPTMEKGQKGVEEVISKRVKVESPTPETPQPAAAPGQGPVEKAQAEQPQPEKATAAPAAEEPVKAAPEAAKAPSTTKEPAKANVAEKAPAAAKRAAQDIGVKKAKKKTAPSTFVAAKSRPWALNVASYSERKSATGLAASLRAAGYNAYLTESIRNGRTWHRVRVGFYRTREEAERAGKAIEKRFDLPSAWVVKPPIKETAANIKR